MDMRENEINANNMTTEYVKYFWRRSYDKRLLVYSLCVFK